MAQRVWRGSWGYGMVWLREFGVALGGAAWLRGCGVTLDGVAQSVWRGSEGAA